MQQFILENRDKIIELCRTHHVLRLSVFGSAVRDDFNPETSGVDMLVDFEPPVTFRYAKNFFALQKALAAAIGRDVDLVVSESIENPILWNRIEQQKKLLYGT